MRPFFLIPSSSSPQLRLLQLQRQAPPLAPHEARPVERSNERVLHAEMEAENGTNGYILRRDASCCCCSSRLQKQCKGRGRRVFASPLPGGGFWTF